MNAGGPPPPPPPPPIPGILPSSRLPSEIPAHSSAMNNDSPPAVLASAMMKERKPFTYTPGGLDLSEISNQPNQNGNSVDQPDFGPPVQSRSFKVLQNVLDHHDTAGSDDEISNYMQPIVSQAYSSVPEVGHPFQQPTFNPSQYQPQQISEQGLATIQALGENNAHNLNSGIMCNAQNFNTIPPKEGPTSSRFFRRLQTITDTLPQGAEPQGPIHIPTMRQSQQPPPRHQPQPNQQYYQQPTYQQQSGVNNNAANPEQQAVPEPKKYMGGNIPSRSFRMLQAMTGADDTTDAGVPANTSSESCGQPDGVTQPTANQTLSPNPQSPVPNSPSSSSLSPLTHLESHDISSDSGISSPSKINSYTIGKDNKVYRHVSPQITFNGGKERVVNSALSNSRETSSPTWTVNCQPQNFTPINQSSPDASGKPDTESPRLMNRGREEPASPNPQIVERRYEGGYIPSRVFRHLQSEYPSGDPNELQEPKTCFGSKSPSPRSEGGAIPPRVLKSIQNEANSSFESDTTDGENASRASSSLAELDEYYTNGMAARTAVTKDTVLKELASQFDQTGIRKKPRAAPGRVFRYLQSQYDTPEDTAEYQNSQPAKNTLKQEQEESAPGFGYRGAKLPSPSFKYLQTQYSNDQDEQQKIHSEPVYPDMPMLKKEPLPYQGCKVPGRTFKSLQGDVANHPSVFAARKK